VDWYWVVLIALVVAAAAAYAGYMYRKSVSEARIGNAQDIARKLLEESQEAADRAKKEAILEAKEEAHRIRADLDKEIRDRRSEISRVERRLQQKEDTLDMKTSALEVREEKVTQQKEEAARLREKAQKLYEQQLAELERISGLTNEEAKQMILDAVEEETRHDAAVLIRNIERDTKADADRMTREILAGVIQRTAADHVAEATVSVVNLPNEEMKGRIIGREGRNIRTLETATGVDFIIDDTPEAVILSAFDPVRREVARLALEKLVVDGRIHPARIEEMVNKAQKEVDTAIREAGEQALFEVGITGIHPEMVKVLGRMRYRTSYGQNVLNHSIEVANLAGMLAAELGADVRLAKRGGLLHDIGKAIDHEVEGTHVKIGADLARKYRESNEIVHIIAAHHNDIEPQTVEALLVQAADAISGARPGARRESLENYIKRLEQLESIANSFEGVDKSYAIQAGREVRIAVIPERISDDQMVLLARDIAHKIESEMEYPGQIKVNVIRETRASDIAK